MRICAFDPGLKGGIALYNGETLTTHRIPTFKIISNKKKKDEYDLPSIVYIIIEYNPEIIIIENVHAMPGQGVTSMFNFGKGLGILIGIAAGLQITTIKVRPQEWKKHFGLIKKEKIESINLAKSLFPDNIQDFKYKTRDEGRAEASLIAKYFINSDILLDC